MDVDVFSGFVVIVVVAICTWHMVIWTYQFIELIAIITWMLLFELLCNVCLPKVTMHCMSYICVTVFSFVTCFLPSSILAQHCRNEEGHEKGCRSCCACNEEGNEVSHQRGELPKSNLD